VATIEYVALFVVVSLALAVGGAAVDAQALPGAVARELHKAYCLVANGDCLGPGGSRPCVVTARSRSDQTEVGIVLVTLRDGRTVLREQLSDGTVRVTVAANGGVSLGARFGVKIGGRGAEIDASAGADVGTERTFVVPDAAAAQQLVDRLDEDAPPVGAVARDAVDFVTGAKGGEDVRAVTIGPRAQVAATLSALDLGPSLGTLASMTAGVKVDRRTGRRTVLLRLPREASAALSTPIGSLDAGLQWDVGVEAVFDRHGKGEALILRGRGAVGTGKGTRVEADAQLDLADPETRALIDRLTHGDLGVVDDIGRRLADRARIDVRRYATESDSTTRGVGLMGLGGEKTVVKESSRLVSARGREPGGSWGPNLECLHAT
jgi:hypothetical protein